MANSTSAGLLMFSRTSGELRVLLTHPGGPFFAKKDDGAWTIPKGLVEDGEDLLTAARREFSEETGYCLADDTAYIPLGNIVLGSGKVVHAWAFQGEWQLGRVPQSNTFLLEWPPRSGIERSFPEIDRAEMFTIKDARRKVNKRQTPFLDRLMDVTKTDD